MQNYFKELNYKKNPDYRTVTIETCCTLDNSRHAECAELEKKANNFAH